MKLTKKWLPEVLNDNEEVYFAHLTGVLESVDELCEVQVTKIGQSYHFRVVASLPRYNQFLLEEILGLHNRFNIKLKLSKSIKTSTTINFIIDL